MLEVCRTALDYSEALIAILGCVIAFQAGVIGYVVWDGRRLRQSLQPVQRSDRLIRSGK